MPGACDGSKGVASAASTPSASPPPDCSSLGVVAVVEVVMASWARIAVTAASFSKWSVFRKERLRRLCRKAGKALSNKSSCKPGQYERSSSRKEDLKAREEEKEDEGPCQREGEVAAAKEESRVEECVGERVKEGPNAIRQLPRTARAPSNDREWMSRGR